MLQWSMTWSWSSNHHLFILQSDTHGHCFSMKLLIRRESIKKIQISFDRICSSLFFNWSLIWMKKHGNGLLVCFRFRKKSTSAFPIRCFYSTLRSSINWEWQSRQTVKESYIVKFFCRARSANDIFNSKK